MNKISWIAVVCAFLAMSFAIIACSLPDWVRFEFNIPFEGAVIRYKSHAGPFRVCVQATLEPPSPDFKQLDEECKLLRTDCSVDGYDPEIEDNQVVLIMTENPGVTCRKYNAARSFLVIGAITAGISAIIMAAVIIKAGSDSPNNSFLYIVAISLSVLSSASFIVSFAIVIDYHSRLVDIANIIGAFGGAHSEDLSSSFILTVVSTALTIVGTIIYAILAKPEQPQMIGESKQVPLTTIATGAHAWN